MPTKRLRCDELVIGREPLNHYGTLEPMIRCIRDQRPLDLNAENWRTANPQGTFEEWQMQARRCLREGLAYAPGPCDLQTEVLGRVQRDGYIQEHVAFNSTPWNRIEGYFLLPDGVGHPVPAIIAMHAWGGPILFGKERIVDSGRDHPALAEHRDIYYGGQYCAEVFARRGYAVLVIDAHHFGARIPLGTNGIPEKMDPFNLRMDEFIACDELVKNQVYLGVRQLNWAGATWAGVNFWDDRRCIDYLLSRPEVDGARIGCTGLSGGGWRTNLLASLDPRLKAAVSSGWMTTGDYQQVYNVAGAIGSFCLLPGVWNRLDIPDLIAMSAPCATLVQSPSQDRLFPVEGQEEAVRQIGPAYAWAGCPERFRASHSPKPHCFDQELQAEALDWFDMHL